MSHQCGESTLEDSVPNASLRTKGEGRTTARGTIVTALSSTIAVLSGAVTTVYLARTMGPETFGIWALVLSVVTWCEFAAFSFWTQSIPKFISGSGDNWRRLADTAFSGSLLCFIAWVIVLALAATPIADFFREPQARTLILFFAVDIPLIGLYRVCTSVLSGRERYIDRAIGDALYWVTKFVFMCGLVALGYGIPGAISGSILASVVGLWWSWSRTSIRPRLPNRSLRPLLVFSAPIMLVAVSHRLLQNIDLWMVKGTLSSAKLAGFYGVSMGVVQAGVLISGALTVTVLPSVSRALAEERTESARNTVRQGYRFALTVIAAGIAIMAANAAPLIKLVFSAQYSEAAIPATILTGAALMLSLMALGQAILVATGYPYTALWAVLPLVPIDVGLNWLLITRFELVGAAMATTLTGTTGALVLGLLVWRELKAGLPALTILRVAIAAFVAYYIGRSLQFSGIGIIAECAIMCVAYVGALTATRELRQDDLEPLMFWR